MSIHRTIGLGAAIFPLLTLLAACAPSDDERCGDGFVWADHTCNLIADTSTETGDTDSDTDSGLPSGLGEPCTEDGGECDGFEADYCAINPTSGDGYCTVLGCATEPDDCPEGYLCCDFPPTIEQENFCVTEAEFEEMASLCNG